MDDTWVVVANQTDARILAHRRGHPVWERETLVCPEARLAERDLVTDAPGRSHDRMGTARHAMEPHTELTHQIADRFAQRVAVRLEEGCRQNAFRGLVLVAGPSFLGRLRQQLGAQCLDRVVAECRKNIVTRDIGEIIAVLPERLQRTMQVRPST